MNVRETSVMLRMPFFKKNPARPFAKSFFYVRMYFKYYPQPEKYD